MTLVLGYVGTLGTEALRDRSERGRQAAGALAARAAARSEFQRATLLELQEAVQRYVRRVGKVSAQDVANFRETGKWSQKPAVGAGGGLAVVIGTVRLRASRVADADIRAEIDTLMQAGGRALLAASQESQEAQFDLLVDSLVRTHERIGAVLRTL